MNSQRSRYNLHELYHYQSGHFKKTMTLLPHSIATMLNFGCIKHQFQFNTLLITCSSWPGQHHWVAEWVKNHTLGYLFAANWQSSICQISWKLLATFPSQELFQVYSHVTIFNFTLKWPKDKQPVETIDCQIFLIHFFYHLLWLTFMHWLS